MMKTAVCVGNGTWLPQMSCGGDDCTRGTDSEGTYVPTYVSNYILFKSINTKMSTLNSPQFK